MDEARQLLKIAKSLVAEKKIIDSAIGPIQIQEDGRRGYYIKPLRLNFNLHGGSLSNAGSMNDSYSFYYNAGKTAGRENGYFNTGRYPLYGDTKYFPKHNLGYDDYIASLMTGKTLWVGKKDLNKLIKKLTPSLMKKIQSFFDKIVKDEDKMSKFMDKFISDLKNTGSDFGFSQYRDDVYIRLENPSKSDVIKALNVKKKYDGKDTPLGWPFRVVVTDLERGAKDIEGPNYLKQLEEEEKRRKEQEKIEAELQAERDRVNSFIDGMGMIGFPTHYYQNNKRIRQDDVEYFEMRDRDYSAEEGADEDTYDKWAQSIIKKVEDLAKRTGFKVDIDDSYEYGTIVVNAE
jgi:hypothetical protein